jgi:hypothetical protein
MCIENIVDFTYDADNLYVVNNNNCALVANKSDIICADTLAINFSRYYCIERDCKLFALYQGKRIQTNFDSEYDHPLINIFSDDNSKCENVKVLIHKLFFVKLQTVVDHILTLLILRSKIMMILLIYTCEMYMIILLQYKQ